MKRLWAAFLNALSGLKWAARYETAVLQELAVLAAAIPASFFITDINWLRIALIGVVALLLIVELLNTALEKLCDHLAPEISPQIKIVKDAGAAAVFVAILLAALTWLYALFELLY